MKKALAIILCGLMMIGPLCIGVFAAPEGTAIKNADDFAAMAEDGKYYLDADIRIDTTYEKIFTGTLDGNGHTVTVSVPMFQELNGTVKNLTTDGLIEGTESHIAPLAVQSISGVTVENCVNKANVTLVTAATGSCAAGFIAITRSQDTFFINCVNEGAISCTETADRSKTWGRCGGFVGASNAGEFTNCVNNGAIYMKGSDSAGGGFIGKAGDQNGSYFYIMKFCTNNGPVEVVNVENPGYASNVAGGFFGAAFGGGDMGMVQFEGCANYGTVKGTNYIGGYIGWEWGSGDFGVSTFRYCISAGDVIVPEWNNASGEPNTTRPSAFVSYCGTTSEKLEYCLVTAKITTEGNAKIDNKALLAAGKAGYNNANYKSVYISEFAEYDSVVFGNSEDNTYTIDAAKADGAVKIVTYAEITGGEAARKLNADSKLADGIKFDESINDGSVVVMEVKEEPVVTEAPTQPQDQPTEAPTQPQDQPTEAPTQPQDQPTEAPTQPQDQPTDAPTEAPTDTDPADDKGCGSAVACGLVLLTILGSAVVAKKKSK